jgi:hypothetical protein
MLTVSFEPIIFNKTPYACMGNNSPSFLLIFLGPRGSSGNEVTQLSVELKKLEVIY